MSATVWLHFCVKCLTHTHTHTVFTCVCDRTDGHRLRLLSSIPSSSMQNVVRYLMASSLSLGLMKPRMKRWRQGWELLHMHYSRLGPAGPRGPRGPRSRISLGPVTGALAAVSVCQTANGFSRPRGSGSNIFSRVRRHSCRAYGRHVTSEQHTGAQLTHTHTHTQSRERVRVCVAAATGVCVCVCRTAGSLCPTAR